MKTGGVIEFLRPEKCPEKAFYKRNETQGFWTEGRFRISEIE